MSHTGLATIIFLVFMILFISVMIVFIITILFVVQKKQKGFTEDLIAVKINYEKELYKAKFETQEHTLQQIARELHDNVCQILSLAKLNLGLLDFERSEEAKESIPEISDIIASALDDLRDLSRTLNSEIIKNGGLKKSIEMQVRMLQRNGKFVTHFNVMGVPDVMDETKDVILFRILQEAVHNIIKHSKASHVSISLNYDPGWIKLEVKDNGRGFELNKQIEGPNSANGIHNIRYRAALIGGECIINSDPGKGTIITVTTPVNKH